MERAEGSGNRTRHGVSFESACEVFFDRLATISDADVDDEARWALTGTNAVGTLLYVVHLMRDNEGLRIISARKVDAREQKRYENGS